MHNDTRAFDDVQFDDSRGSAIRDAIHSVRQRLSVRIVSVADVPGLTSSSSSRDVGLLVIVEEGLVQRSRLRSGSFRVDVIVMGEAIIEQEIRRGADLQLAELVAKSHYICGRPATIERLRERAQTTVALGAPPLSPSDRFRLACQPFDLVRQFEETAKTDTATAGLILTALIRVCVDGYFMRNRLIQPRLKDVVSQLAARDRNAAESLSRVLQSDIDALGKESRHVRDMVKSLVGEEDLVSTLWCDGVIAEGHANRASAGLQVTRKTHQKPLLRLERAMEAYTRSRDIQQ